MINDPPIPLASSFHFEYPLIKSPKLTKILKASIVNLQTIATLHYEKLKLKMKLTITTTPLLVLFSTLFDCCVDECHAHVRCHHGFMYRRWQWHCSWIHGKCRTRCGQFEQYRHHAAYLQLCSSPKLGHYRESSTDAVADDCSPPLLRHPRVTATRAANSSRARESRLPTLMIMMPLFLLRKQTSKVNVNFRTFVALAATAHTALPCILGAIAVVVVVDFVVMTTPWRLMSWMVTRNPSKKKKNKTNNKRTSENLYWRTRPCLS